MVVMNVVVMLCLSLLGLVRFCIIVIRFIMVLMMFMVGEYVLVFLKILVVLMLFCLCVFSFILSMLWMVLGLLLLMSSCRFLCVNGLCMFFSCGFRLSRFWWCEILF